MTLSDEKKLTVLFRVEPGCLGPKGVQHVDPFCASTQQLLQQQAAQFIRWQVLPRHDKTLPEMDYAINGKGLNRDLAARYLAHFGLGIDDFEMQAFDQLPEMIDQFFGR